MWKKVKFLEKIQGEGDKGTIAVIIEGKEGDRSPQDRLLGQALITGNWKKMDASVKGIILQKPRSRNGKRDENVKLNEKLHKESFLKKL